MEPELEDRALQEGATSKPTAGYLYFPVGKKKASRYELVYQADNADVKMEITSK